MRDAVKLGIQPISSTLTAWANTLERDEQQTPPVATGEPCSGESSVQPGAILQKFSDAIDKHIEQVRALRTNHEFDRGYAAGYTSGAFDAEETLQEILQVKHEAEHDAAG